MQLGKKGNKKEKKKWQSNLSLVVSAVLAMASIERKMGSYKGWPLGWLETRRKKHVL